MPGTIEDAMCLSPSMPWKASAGSAAITWTLRFCSFKWRPVPMIVPPVPMVAEVESRIVFPGTSRPRASPSSIILRAGRSFTEPPGLKPSSLPRMRTPGATPSRARRISTSGVLPTSWSAEGTASGPAAGEVGRARTARAESTGGPRLAASGDRRDDRQLVPRLEGRVEVREEADVLAVDEDVHEAPHLSRLVTDALLQPRVAPLEIVHERGHRRPLRLDPPGAPRVLAERRWYLDLDHDDGSSFPLLVRRRSPRGRRSGERAARRSRRGGPGCGTAARPCRAPPRASCSRCP